MTFPAVAGTTYVIEITDPDNITSTIPSNRVTLDGDIYTVALDGDMDKIGIYTIKITATNTASGVSDSLTFKAELLGVDPDLTLEPGSIWLAWDKMESTDNFTDYTVEKTDGSVDGVYAPNATSQYKDTEKVGYDITADLAASGDWATYLIRRTSTADERNAVLNLSGDDAIAIVVQSDPYEATAQVAPNVTDYTLTATGTGFELAWIAPELSKPVESYTMTFYEASDADKTAITSPIAVEEGKSYDVIVKGDAALLIWDSFPQDNKPVQVTKLVMSTVTFDEAAETVSFDQVAGAAGYVLQITDASGDVIDLASVNGINEAIKDNAAPSPIGVSDVLDALDAIGGNETYTFSVKAIGDLKFNTDSDYASAAETYTVGNTVAAVTDINFTVSGETATTTMEDVTVNWTLPANMAGITGFDVYVDEVKVNAELIGADATSYAFENDELAAAGMHTVKIVSVPTAQFTENSESADILRLAAPVVHADRANAKLLISYNLPTLTPQSYLVNNSTIAYTGSNDQVQFGTLPTIADAAGNLSYNVISVGKGAEQFELNSAISTATVGVLGAPDLAFTKNAETGAYEIAFTAVNEDLNGDTTSFKINTSTAADAIVTSPYTVDNEFDLVNIGATANVFTITAVDANEFMLDGTSDAVMNPVNIASTPIEKSTQISVYNLALPTDLTFDGTLLKWTEPNPTSPEVVYNVKVTKGSGASPQVIETEIPAVTSAMSVTGVDFAALFAAYGDGQYNVTLTPAEDLETYKDQGIYHVWLGTDGASVTINYDGDTTNTVPAPFNLVFSGTAAAPVLDFEVSDPNNLIGDFDVYVSNGDSYNYDVTATDGRTEYKNIELKALNSGTQITVKVTANPKADTYNSAQSAELTLTYNAAPTNVMLNGNTLS